MNTDSKEAAVRSCLSFPHTYQDQPFRDSEWILIRHTENRKAFAFIYEKDGYVCINLKCEPMKAAFLRDNVSYIFPAYHMNKTHWITLRLVPETSPAEVMGLLEESYLLTK